MRILQVHKDFEPFKGGGGTARHIHGLSKALATHGCETRVASLRPEIIQAPYTSFHASVQALRPHVEWADVVHVHGARSKYALAGAIQAAFAGKPFFYTPHAYYGSKTAANALFKAAWDRTAEKFMIERGAATILLTDAWHNFLSARGISRDRTTIIPNCVLEEDLMLPQATVEVPRLAGTPAILTIGRLDPVKRVRDIIKALACAPLAKAHFHVVGRGDERSTLERLAADIGVSDRVTFHGFVDDASVAQMVAGSDVFVLASEQEGLPTVLLEMLIAKQPVVCTRIPGNLAITNVAEISTTYDVGDIERLAILLKQAVEERVTDASVTALKRAFTWEQRAMDVLTLYNSASV